MPRSRGVQASGGERCKISLNDISCCVQRLCEIRFKAARDSGSVADIGDHECCRVNTAGRHEAATSAMPIFSPERSRSGASPPVDLKLNGAE